MNGQDAIKSRTVHPHLAEGLTVPGYHARATRGVAYLPQPSGMSGQDYEAYKTRAAWFGASARVRQGLVGLVFREGPEVVAPELILEHAKDITYTGVNLEAFSLHAVTEHLTTGRIGILLDLAEEDQPANAVRPQWSLFQAEQIINWRAMRSPFGETVYSQIVLEEHLDLPHPEDPYQHTLTLHWRELVLEDGIYVVRLWRKMEGTRDLGFMLIDERVPTRRGMPLPFIPFLILNADSRDVDLGSPPLLDVIDINFSHYRTNADYQHELHMCSLATPWVTGWDNKEAELQIGAMTAWVIPEPNARVGFLEVSGHGLQAKLDKLRSDEAQMAILGARLLEGQKHTVEAAETHQIRQHAELSIMETYAEAASTVLTKALRWHTWWAGLTEDLDDDRVTVTLNTDFLPTKLTAQELTALVGAWQAGALTQEDLYYNLQAGNLLEPGVTLEAWISKLGEQSMVSLLTTPVPGGNG